MSNAKPDTRKLILDTAEELLLTRSFSAFSYSNIATTLGVKNAADRKSTRLNSSHQI